MLATSLVLALHALPAYGPPAICFPIDIGRAASLPFGDDPFATKADFPIERVAPEALRILSSSDRVLVHMETIRRAAVYYSDLGRGPKKKGQGAAHAQAFVRGLRLCVLEVASRDDASARSRALCWFDLGYTLGVFTQVRLAAKGSWRDYLRMSARLAPGDAAVHLGACLADYRGNNEDPKAGWRYHLRSVCALVTDPEDPVARNAVATMGRFLDAKDFASLRARLGKAVK